MIIFNGVDLQEIAPIKIDDIKVSPIQTSPVARQRVGFGQDFVRMNGSSRTVTVIFALLEQDKDKRFDQIQQIVRGTYLEPVPPLKGLEARDPHVRKYFAE